MTPTQKRVFNLLASAQEPRKVELSIIGDLQKALNQNLNIRKKMDSQMNAAVSALYAYENIFEQIQKDITYGEESIGTLETFKLRIKNEVEKLGLDSNEIQEYKEIDKAINATKSILTPMNNLPNVD
jgi:hypothetical protein